MRTTEIASLIERDLLRDDTDRRTDITKCFMCGGGMVYRGNRFCSDRCRAWFDDGNPSYQERRQSIRHAGDMRPGIRGFHIQCAGCQKEFESLGLRCCSIECERRNRERQDNIRLMAEAGIEPAPKRQCETCGAVIPKWRNGRKVTSAARFCSSKCAQKARRGAGSVLAPLTPETTKKCPIHGASGGGAL